MEERPDLVMIAGDVNSTMACTLVVVKLEFKVTHLELACVPLTLVCRGD